MKDNTTSALESGKKTSVERDFRGIEKGKQRVNEGGKSNTIVLQKASVLKDSSKGNVQTRPITHVEKAQGTL